MQRKMIEERQKDMRNFVTELLQRGEDYALAGSTEFAESALEQVWKIAEAQVPDLANIAAWEMAWLLLRRRAFIEATEWVNRIVAPLPRESRLWPASRQALVQICLMLGDKRAEGIGVLALPSRIRSHSSDDIVSSTLPVLKVMNLGHFQLARGGALLPVCTAHKATSLFRYLLTRYHRVAYKEELMELLWPNAGPREALNSLHVAVSGLRRYLDSTPQSYILFEDGRYLINPAASIEDDSASFEHLYHKGALAWEASDLEKAQDAYMSALACYQGDYYVDNRDAAWALAEQERLLVHYMSALDSLGQICIAQKYFTLAIECYQRLLERDPYREDAHCQLLRCYSALGRRSDALQQYRRCVTILADDLGLVPMPETQALFRAISGVGDES